eukprot:CAMPEP_0196571802 /NCGR_PEP_ID=MMETSP1081-20130531/1939_1 /TAXON_ID=36882 /ORGANISM="Pyramimonas amylifera, Strain CCMP720" /LENGTH=553 /DNA_ID=CAMNT_0041888893 /DNA_START=167 /DNA_END=1828 /DNA_ORIENTATION=+
MVFKSTMLILFTLSFLGGSLGARMESSWNIQPETKFKTKEKLSELIGYTAEAVSDRIESLPGLDADISFNMFSGYLEVDAVAGRNLFYWFVEAEKNPSSAPVMLWTNGGPGCSGLIGFMTEQGPFRPTAKGEALELNDYNWNKLVNIFFIEQPAGVGYSYSLDESDYLDMGDVKAAKDNYNAIVAFFKKFPQFKPHDFYISSESYGGHYMPMLAKELVDGNAIASADARVNFKGLLVGNPYTNPDENNIGIVGTYWGHQLAPKPLADRWYKDCIIQTGVCPEWATECKEGSRHVRDHEVEMKCQSLRNQIKTSAGKVNPYGLDWPVCNHRDYPEVAKASASLLLEVPSLARTSPSLARKGAGMAQRAQLVNFLNEENEDVNDELLGGKNLKEIVPEDDWRIVPCEEDYATWYLNRKDVQAAVHVYQPGMAGRNWSQCTNRHHIHYNKTDSKVDMTPYYKYLLDGKFGLDILIYSGDADSVCATEGTQTWVYDMEVEVTADWAPWVVDDQVAGYVTKFDGFTLLTVHDAGHEVPTYQPKMALEMLKRYFNNSNY